jgi:protein-tyrosine phosphatase
VNTVHFQTARLDGITFEYKFVKSKIEELQNELDKEGIPIKLHMGAEVFYLPNLMELKDNPLLTFDHGKYMLVEFPVDQVPNGCQDIFFKLKLAGVTPIIAHPERYKPVQDDINIVAELLAAGCIIQVDAGSPLGYLGSGSQKASEQIIKNGWCQILGSDSHNNERRNFCLKEAVDLIQLWDGNGIDELVLKNPMAVIKGQPILVDFEYVVENDPNFFSRIKHRIGLT